MERITTNRPRMTSVSMFTLAVLLISSMGLREYAHIIDHARHFQSHRGTFSLDFNHEAKFHCLTEAESAFEPPCVHQQVVAILQLLREDNSSSQPRLLPATRAPPAFS